MNLHLEEYANRYNLFLISITLCPTTKLDAAPHIGTLFRPAITDALRNTPVIFTKGKKESNIPRTNFPETMLWKLSLL